MSATYKITFKKSAITFNPNTEEQSLKLDGSFVEVSLEAAELRKIGNEAVTVLWINEKGYGSLLTPEQWEDMRGHGDSIQTIIDSIPTREEVENNNLNLTPEKTKQLLGLRKVTASSLITIRDNIATASLDSIRKHIDLCSFLDVTDEAFMDLVSQLHHVVRQFGTCSDKEKLLTIPRDSPYHMNKLHMLGIKN